VTGGDWEVRFIERATASCRVLMAPPATAMTTV
jgi:hypothetical protein